MEVIEISTWDELKEILGEIPKGTMYVIEFEMLEVDHE